MSRLHVLICRVDDDQDQLTELASFELPAAPARWSAEPLNQIEAQIEAQIAALGPQLVGRLCEPQWEAVDAAAGARHCAQAAPGRVWADGYETLTVASRSGTLHLRRQVCAHRDGRPHSMPGTALLPSHAGLLPQEVPCATAARLLGWQAGEPGLLSASTLRTLVRDHGNRIRQLEQTEAVVALSHRRQGRRLRGVPLDRPRHRPGWPPALRAAVDAALAQRQPRPPEGVSWSDWQRVLAARAEDATLPVGSLLCWLLSTSVRTSLGNASRERSPVDDLWFGSMAERVGCLQGQQTHHTEGTPFMLAHLVPRLRAAAHTTAQVLRQRLYAATRPATAPIISGTLADLARTKPELLLEHALLRQQLIILRRSVRRPRCTPTDRTLLVLLASRLQSWRQSLRIVQPDTLLRWHRELFRRSWRRRSRPAAPAHRPPVAPETVALIRQMAAADRTWGAERIRGELLKLNIRVAKWTIQKYLRGAPPPRRSGQAWATFLRNHGHEVWACDFLPVTDLLFRPLYAFFVIELASRRVVHVNVTRHPTDAWVAQQLREATPFGQHPKHLLRDNDSKYGPIFTQLAAATGIDEVRTAYRAPKENAICERFLGSVRRGCLDHLLILGEAQLRRIVREYVACFNAARRIKACSSGSPIHPRR